ncbi:MAG: TlpA family protein disulfide reductase [Leptospirillia bacterium]
MKGRRREILYQNGNVRKDGGQDRKRPSGGGPGGGVALFLVALLLLFFPGSARAFHQEDRLGISLFDTREQAPEIQAPDLSGKALTLSSFRGKVVLLNFWATWCDACRDEIPALIALARSLKGEPFAVVSVAMDRRTGHIPPFVRKYGIDYTVLEGRKGEIDSRYFGMGLPQSYVIRPDGTLVGRAMGARPWNSPEFVRYFRDLVRKGSSSGEKGGGGNP